MKKDLIRDTILFALAIALFVSAVAVVDAMNVRYEEEKAAQEELERIRERDEEWFNLAEEDYMEDPLESEHIQQAIAELPEKRYELTDDELYLLCGVVMAEAGGESYEGKMAVAQCLLNGCERSGIRPAQAVVDYQYAKPNYNYTDECWEAVTAVFYEGLTVTDETILWFYAPARCTSKWHESQKFVTEIGGHRFFAEKE